ncbi:MAG: Fic family protein [Synergistes sp.]|nr:Fic family protein [Synergistes sp.]
MIGSVITNEMLRLITEIEENRHRAAAVSLPDMVMNRLRKNTMKKSSYASNKIEGNPLTEAEAERAIEADPHEHFLKPELEIRNYFSALSFLDECQKKRLPVTKDLILKVQSIVEQGAPKEKIGLRGPMPPGFLFAVYDSHTGAAEYIPPDHADVSALLEELVDYLAETDDHPLIIAAIAHYQLVTIHPFEDGNGRTARLISGYLLDFYGYGFQGLGSPDEFFAYDTDEYYRSLQMSLPPLYYSGRNNPPHPEIWLTYFLRMMKLYSDRVTSLSEEAAPESVKRSLSFLNANERALLSFLLKEGIEEFTPAALAKPLGVTNRTVINRTAKLVSIGFAAPVLSNAKKRIRAYRLTEFALRNREAISSSGFPFEVTASIPNRKTVAAMKEAKKIAHDPNVKGYTDIDELMKDLSADE